MTGQLAVRGVTTPALDSVLLADVRDLALILPGNSTHLIFTDPPYLREFVPLYGELARLAAHVLKPGGFCLAMGGGLYADQVMALMSEHLTHYYTFHVYLSGSATGKVHPGGNPKPVITRVKPVYAYVKDWGMPRTVVYDPFAGDGNDKRFHYWGQDAKSARYYIDCFSRPGDLVLDPFCGGGTAPVVCQALDRHFIASDIDPAAVEMTRARLSNPLFVPSVNGQMQLAFAEAVAR